MSTAALVDAPPTLHGLEEIEAIARASEGEPAVDDDEEKTLARIESSLEVLIDANLILRRPALWNETERRAAKWAIVGIALEEGFIRVDDQLGLLFVGYGPSDFSSSSVEELGLYMLRCLGGCAVDLADEIEDQRWEERDFVGWVLAGELGPVTPVLAPRPRGGRVRRRRNRSSSRRGPPGRSDDDPPPRPFDLAPEGASLPRAAVSAPRLQMLVRSFGSRLLRANFSYPRGGTTNRKAGTMVPSNPTAAELLRRQINRAIGATFGLTYGGVERRSVHSDGSADAASVDRVRGLLFRALEAIEDGDVAYAFQLASEAGIELEHPGPKP